jgi:hypothetical protein
MPIIMGSSYVVGSHFSKKNRVALMTAANFAGNEIMVGNGKENNSLDLF